ncbi:MAG TPA: addiction module protein, partial [Isosphaeraceae bacterium]|nr:addiction module protein [Isosphaeraceae bacterium]
MSRTVAELLDDALTLPEPDRAELAELLAASLTSPTGSLHPDWAAELRRRAAEVDSGRVQPVAWEEVRQQVWAELNADEPMMKPESPTNEKARPSLRCRTSCCPRSADCWPLTRPDPPDGRTVLQAGFLTQQGYSSLDQIHARRALALVEWNIPSAIDHSE